MVPVFIKELLSKHWDFFIVFLLKFVTFVVYSSFGMETEPGFRYRLSFPKGSQAGMCV